MELISKFHDQLIEQSVCSAFIVLVVSDGGGCNAVKSDPAMALANVVFKADGGLVAERDASGDRA